MVPRNFPIQGDSKPAASGALQSRDSEFPVAEEWRSFVETDAVATVDYATLKGRMYGPLVKECAVRGIRRTMAFGLARQGLISVFLLGRKRFVWIDSLETLPQRLQAMEERKKGDFTERTQR